MPSVLARHAPGEVVDPAGFFASMVGYGHGATAITMGFTCGAGPSQSSIHS
jgi:hypothetical protein